MYNVSTLINYRKSSISIRGHYFQCLSQKIVMIVLVNERTRNFKCGWPHHPHISDLLHTVTLQTYQTVLHNYYINRSTSGGEVKLRLKLDPPFFRHILVAQVLQFWNMAWHYSVQLSSYAGTTFVKSAILNFFYLIKKFTFYKSRCSIGTELN